MSNVIRLFQYGRIDDARSAFKTCDTVEIESILAVSSQLAVSVKRLSDSLDVMDKIIDALGDEKARYQHKLLMKVHRAALIDATLELSKEIRRLPHLQIGCAR